ncbi:MAG TPA: hypothetical protein VFT04_10075 [Gemmatimonadales bacterium]|nr:hypothetical protein [Gemmatimonadales bacterium]
MRLRFVMCVTALLSAGCTPLGLWVYEEPTIEITAVSLTDAGAAEFPVRIALQVSNVNDFAVSLEKVQILLVLNDSPVVDRELATAASFPARDRQTVEIGVAWSDVGPGLRPEGLGPGDHRYSVVGEAMLRTPIGQRRIRFARAGTDTFEEEPAS